ncbi:sapecin-like [Musca autumnalis]|uniref:sapecin-like n=1 Tax=Musca autumnalis TaxID=221902 RepID=UPI003CF0D9A1
MKVFTIFSITLVLLLAAIVTEACAAQKNPGQGELTLNTETETDKYDRRHVIACDLLSFGSGAFGVAACNGQCMLLNGKGGKCNDRGVCECDNS